MGVIYAFKQIVISQINYDQDTTVGLRIVNCRDSEQSIGEIDKLGEM